MDGKGINIEAPANSGSVYFNYMKTFSVILLALVDVNYNFILNYVSSFGETVMEAYFHIRNSENIWKTVV